MFINIYYMNSIYKIKFEESSSFLRNYYDTKLSNGDKRKIERLEALSYFDYEENEKYICILIASIYDIKEYLSIMSKNSIKFRYSDMSDDILKRRIDIINELRDKVNESSSVTFSFFTEDLESWIFDNLNIDIVLDKISEVGIENLSDIENKFLKNLNNEKNE